MNCPIEGCQIDAGDFLLCRTHAMLVPLSLWRAVGEARRAHGRGSPAHRAAAELAIRSVYHALRQPAPQTEEGSL